MPNVKVVLREGDVKLYEDATAYSGNDRVLRIMRHNMDSETGGEIIAEFQPEFYQYWEYTDWLSTP
jgi:hypothetical protein